MPSAAVCGLAHKLSGALLGGPCNLLGLLPGGLHRRQVLPGFDNAFFEPGGFSPAALGLFLQPIRVLARVLFRFGGPQEPTPLPASEDSARN